MFPGTTQRAMRLVAEQEFVAYEPPVPVQSARALATETPLPYWAQNDVAPDVTAQLPAAALLLLPDESEQAAADPISATRTKK